MLRLFDTARAKVVTFEPRDPGKVSMYVCGPTVYGPAHLGHGRFSLVFDVIRRYFEWLGNEVTYVSNITDIDDKIIERARAQGVTTEEVVAENEKLWWEVMDALSVKRPTHDPHATAYVGEMVALIERLVAAGHAYETSDGVYFTPQVVADYGLLARQSIESLQAGARVAANDEKRSPIDFVLWKKSKPGEPTWPSPWGDGRPGWHTECVVMSLDLLGDGFDIHGGGQDLAFPHHENERAQAVAEGHTFARHWMHNGFVEVDGEKMAKSSGNFTNLVDLIESTDPRAYRLLVLQSHYRTPVEVTHDTTDDASAALARLDSFSRRSAILDLEAEPDETVLVEFQSHMDDDFDTPGAVAVLFMTVTEANRAIDDKDLTRAAGLAAAVREICGAVGLELRAPTDDEPIPVEDLALASQRDEARKAKDWSTADAIRNELDANGYIVEDSPDGTRIRRA